MRLGAFDYIQKPLHHEQELLVKVAKALDNRRTGRPGDLPRQPQRSIQVREHHRTIARRSRSARAHLRIAPTDAIVLITFPARAARWQGARRQGHPRQQQAHRTIFVPVSTCAAITETLLESELFGHAKGSFTGAVSARKGLFEEAEGGTFFFDEIAETPITFQAKLLRAIQKTEDFDALGESKAISVDVRHHRRDQSRSLDRGRREALPPPKISATAYNVARFQLPPLRETPRD